MNESPLALKLKELGFLFRIKKDASRDIYKLSTPSWIEIDKTIIGQFLTLPKSRESGGVLVAAPLIEEGRRKLRITNVRVLKNISLRPRISYLWNEVSFVKVRNYCVDNGFIPLSFHTHPVRGKDFVEKIIEFFRQIETSQADREKIEKIYLNSEQVLFAPDILIVPGLLGIIVFGVYGGFVALKSLADTFTYLLLKPNLPEMTKNINNLLSGILALGIARATKLDKIVVLIASAFYPEMEYLNFWHFIYPYLPNVKKDKIVIKIP